MSNVKLFVCCHQQEEIPSHPLLIPIQVGAELTEKRFPGFIQDSDGDNISIKNRSYCELTALYWAWKNTNYDYIGIFHYRRFLFPCLRAQRPYFIESHPSLSILKKLGYDRFEDLIRQYELIVPIEEQMYVPVREHYSKAPFHREKDLILAENIIKDIYPEYREALEKYFSGTFHCFGNIAIFSRNVLDHYCRWLFSILEEFDRRSDLANYNAQELRVDGYIAERLLGVYYTRHKTEMKTLELPRVFFVDDPRKRIEMKAVNSLLPPGSRQRAWVKNKIYGR